MRNHFKKLAVICNVCFWLGQLARYVESQRYIHHQVLATIIVLGIMALAANIVWLVVFWRQTRVAAPKANQLGLPGLFNLISLVCQLVALVTFYM